MADAGVQFNPKLAALFARFHDFERTVQYCLRVNPVQVSKGQKCDFLLYSTELRAEDFPLTDRLAFYY